MEDFESLLRGAASNYEKDQLSEAAVSEMIDNRLVASKSELQASFKKEIRIIVYCLVAFIIYISLAKYAYRHTRKPEILDTYIKVCVGAIVYYLASIILFVRLLKISSLEKDKGIRSYVTVLYKKTKWAVQLYFWTSVPACIVMIVALLSSYKFMPLYGSILITVVSSILIYYITVWYINIRFGKKLRELEQLIAEFNEPDK
jgi:pilus assembly protein TadC